MSKWLKADKKTVRDGSHATWYESGWHVLKSKPEADLFLEKMFRIKKNRKVIPVYAKKLRFKTHSNRNVYLAEEMYVIEEVLKLF